MSNLEDNWSRTAGAEFQNVMSLVVRISKINAGFRRPDFPDVVGKMKALRLDFNLELQ